MGFILGVALLVFGVSFTKPAVTTVSIKATSLPHVHSIPHRKKHPVGVIDKLEVHISRTF